MPVLDPDATAKVIDPANFDGSVLAAGRQVLAASRGRLNAGASFAVETTLSGNTYLRMARGAKALGYSTAMIYVGLANVDLSICRVQRRVELGGHSVPEIDIRRRYPRSMANLKAALSIMDFVVIFDNSTDAGYRLLAITQGGSIQWLEPVPGWATHLGQGT